MNRRSSGKLTDCNLTSADLPSLTVFRESPEMVHDLPVSRQCYKISRNIGNLIDLFFSVTKHVFYVNSSDAEVITGT